MEELLMQKRFLSMILIVVLLSSLVIAFPLTVSAATSGTCGTNVNWSFDETTSVLRIYGSNVNNVMTNYNPEATPWYSYREKIKNTSVNVASVGNGTFYNCSNLGNVIFPHVKVIGYHAFDGCANLRKINFPYSLTAMMDYAFANCIRLTQVIIPDTVTTLGEGVFYNCGTIRFANIPNSIRTIPKYAFKNCSAMKYFNISTSVTAINEGAFDGCNSLTDLYYAGTETQWNAVTGREYLPSGITIHYGSVYSPSATYPAHYKSDLIPGGNGTVPLLYSDDYFIDNTGYEYNHNLARASLALELTSWTYNSTAPAHNIAGLLQSQVMGMFTQHFVNYSKPLTDNSDKAAYVISHKTLTNGEPIIVVVVRGGRYGAEWRSNMNVGSGSLHTGFSTPAQDIYADLVSYMNNNSIGNNCKIWITGYSRGAAIANILAGKINENQLIKPDNVYAYTFATPSGVDLSKVDADAEVHNNIYNIVLPYDAIPRVVMPEFGYGKYGKTLTVKNRNPIMDKDDYFQSNYRNYFQDNIENELEEYFYNLTGKRYSVGVGQTATAKTITKALAKLVGNKDNYVNTYQALLKDLIEAFMCYDSPMEFCNARYKNLADYPDACKKAKKLAADLAALVPGLSNEWCLEYIYPIEIMSYMNGFLEEEMLEALINNKSSLIDILTSLSDVGSVFDSHNPEYYISWLYAFDNPKDIYDTGTYKKLTIACPVNINVYDAEDNLVVSVIDNKVVTAVLPVEIIGESAEIYFNDEDNLDDYRIEVTAYDDGNVNYSVTEYADFEENRKINYSNIPVKTGDKLEASVPQAQDVQAEIYNVSLTTNEEQNEISYSSELTDETLNNLSVTVSVEGDGSASGLQNVSQGDLVSVTATPYYDAEFLGWYDVDDNLLSSDLIYSFIIQNDIELVAKFTECSGMIEITSFPEFVDGKINIDTNIKVRDDDLGIYRVAVYDENNRLIFIESLGNVTKESDSEHSDTIDLSAVEETPQFVKLFLWTDKLRPISLCKEVTLLK